MGIGIVKNEHLQHVEIVFGKQGKEDGFPGLISHRRFCPEEPRKRITLIFKRFIILDEKDNM